MRYLTDDKSAYVKPNELKKAKGFAGRHFAKVKALREAGAYAMIQATANTWIKRNTGR